MQPTLRGAQVDVAGDGRQRDLSGIGESDELLQLDRSPVQPVEAPGDDGVEAAAVQVLQQPPILGRGFPLSALVSLSS